MKWFRLRIKCWFCIQMQKPSPGMLKFKFQSWKSNVFQWGVCILLYIGVQTSQIMRGSTGMMGWRNALKPCKCCACVEELKLFLEEIRDIHCNSSFCWTGSICCLHHYQCSGMETLGAMVLDYWIHKILVYHIRSHLFFSFLSFLFVNWG